jgi:arylsulfatase A-like enzyme
MNRQLVVALLALAGTFCWRSEVHAAPNILIILADDAGYADIGFQGGGINGDFAALTPNLDSLAAGGVRFSSGYVSGPVCCPSRAGLMTGRYQQRFGMEQNIQSEPNAGLPTTETTIANTLKALGYRTYALGKWHLGEDLPEHHPNQRGFDEYFGFSLARGPTSSSPARAARASFSATARSSPRRRISLTSPTGSARRRRPIWTRTPRIIRRNRSSCISPSMASTRRSKPIPRGWPIRASRASPFQSEKPSPR